MVFEGDCRLMLANLLTALRLLLALPVAAGFARPDLMSPAVLLALLLAAVASDLLDGFVARRTGTASAAGQLFDHSTDCLFVSAGLAGAAATGALPMLLPLLVVTAFVQYVLDSRFYHRQKSLRMSFLGRWNGILYFAPLVILALAGLAPDTLASLLRDTARLVAWLLLFSTLASIADRALAPRRRLTPDS